MLDKDHEDALAEFFPRDVLCIILQFFWSHPRDCKTLKMYCFGAEDFTNWAGWGMEAYNAPLIDNETTAAARWRRECWRDKGCCCSKLVRGVSIGQFDKKRK